MGSGVGRARFVGSVFLPFVRPDAPQQFATEMEDVGLMYQLDSWLRLPSCMETVRRSRQLYAGWSDKFTYALYV